MMRKWRPRFEWLALVPLVLAALRALATSWIPVGENALMSLRSRDVLTEHHPWLGTASSSSLTSGTTVSHPGPLLFDLFALPVRLLGPGAGLVIGALLLHSAAVLVAGVAARRAGGERLVVIVTLAFIALQWTLGPQLMLDPWNPHIVLMSFMAFLVCLVAVAVGHSRLLWAAVCFGSVVLQTHVSYVLLVPLLAFGAAGASWWHGRRAGIVRRDWAVAGGVFALLWAQPVWQQLFGSSPGNLGLLLRSGDGEGRVGAGLAWRLVAEVVAAPPWWARSSFDRSVRDMPVLDVDGGRLLNPEWLIGGAVAGLLLVVVAGLLVALAAAARRRGERVAVAMLAVALAGICLAVITAAIIPAAGYGIAPHQLRWLWPLSIWWMVAVAYAVIQLLPAVADGIARSRWLAPGMAVVGVALCVPSYVVPVGVARAPGSMESVRSIVEQVDGAQIPPAVFEPSGMWIGEPYSVPMIATLLANDQPVRVAPDAAAQYGRDRVAGADVVYRLSLRHGAAALVCADAGRLALDTPLTDAQVTEHRAMQQLVLDLVAGLVVNDATLEQRLDGLGQPLVEALADGSLTATVLASGVALSDDDRAVLAAFDVRRAALGIDTVAVFVRPLDGLYGQGCD